MLYTFSVYKYLTCFLFFIFVVFCVIFLPLYYNDVLSNVNPPHKIPQTYTELSGYCWTQGSKTLRRNKYFCNVLYQ